MPIEFASPQDDAHPAGPERPAAEAPRSGPLLPLVFRPGTPLEHARLRALVEDVGFTAEGVYARTDAPSFEKLPQLTDTPENREVEDALDALVRLFLLAVRLPRDAVERVLPAELVSLLLKLVLLQPDPQEPGLLRAPLALTPVRGLLLLSDQWRVLVADAPSDVVYPGSSTNTLEFLKGLPVGPCDALLDIGAGTGIAALLGARGYARHAWASDITGRATKVADFNARLNGLENVSAVEGDMYAAVAHLTFDRIVSHPPYVPARESKVIFRDGGEDGEQITRRVIEGLPVHLRPGGRFYCRCLATDRTDEPLERRIRGMLGPGEDAFDVVVVASMARQTGAYFYSLLANHRLPAREWEAQVALYDRLGVENVVLAYIAIERHQTTRPPLTVRRLLADGTEPDPVWHDWLLHWERMAQDPAFDSVLLETRPILAPDIEVRMSHRAVDGRLHAASCQASTRGPFHFSTEGPPGLAFFFERCDGSRTFGRLRQEMVELSVVPAEAPVEEFTSFARALVGGGLLLIPEHPMTVASPVEG